MRPHARPRVDDRPPPRSTVSPLAIAVVLAALFFGVAAALLSGAPPTPTAPPSSAGAFITFEDLQVFGWTIIGLTAAWVVYRVVQRFRNPNHGRVNPFVTVAVVCLLLLLGFVVIVHLFGPTGVSQGGPTSGQRSNNSTVPPPMPTPTSGGSPGNFTVGAHSFPGWVAYALVIGVTVVAACLTVPLAYAIARRRKGWEAVVPGPTPAEMARAAIAATLAALEDDPNADPRALVVALYGRLLATVDARLVETGSRTAREIEATAVARWRLPPDAARELTRLFEEARYSPHPIGRADTERARAALQKVLDGMDRSSAR
jgi:hypothetical protein